MRLALKGDILASSLINSAAFSNASSALIPAAILTFLMGGIFGYYFLLVVSGSDCLLNQEVRGLTDKKQSLTQTAQFYLRLHLREGFASTHLQRHTERHGNKLWGLKGQLLSLSSMS